jgi:hypothetical protein
MSDNNKKKQEALELWSKCQLDLADMEKDLNKRLNKGNTSAGRRVRAALRELKKNLTMLAKALVELDKTEQ